MSLASAMAAHSSKLRPPLRQSQLVSQLSNDELYVMRRVFFWGRMDAAL